MEDWFSRREGHFTVFAAQDGRLAGWFKAEPLVLPTRLQVEHRIGGFTREANLKSSARDRLSANF